MTPTSFLVLAEGGLISPQPGLAIWTLLSFTIVFVILRWKVWGPLGAMIDEREKTIQDAIDTAKNERAAAEKVLAEQKAVAEQARKEAAEMVRQSQAEVAKAKAELVEKAKAEADALLVTARKTIEAEKAKALSEIRAVAVELAIGAAGNLLNKNLDDAAHKALAADFIEKAAKQGKIQA